MATRATYCFKPSENNSRRRKHFVYIHYDGYPTGAAVYFYNALHHDGKGNFATVFIKANHHAELTDSHEQHGDTEYQYDIMGEGPQAQIMARRLFDSKVVFCGLLHEFINCNSSDIPDFKPFKELQRPFYPPQFVTEDTAKKLLSVPISYLFCPAKNDRRSAKWQDCLADAKAILKVFPELTPNNFSELTA